MGVLCEMQLENPNLVYLPGDVVSGRISLTLDECALIKAVAIKIAGFALTCFENPVKEKKQKQQKTSEGDPVCSTSKDTTKLREVYTNREDYLSTTNYFIGSDAATAKIVEAGVYLYNFAVRLLLNCPSIFDSAFGHIRYELDVFIDYPEHRQSCYSRCIHVKRPFDLRSIAGLNQPISFDVIEKKSFLKFWQRPLQLQVNIQQTGFIPGESISVHLKVLNYDLLTLTAITYKLNLVASFVGMLKSKAKMHLTRSNLVKTVHSLFGQNGSVIEHLQNIPIPETPPTLNITECRCIQISYELEVEVSASTKNRGITTVLPITIGTISIANKQKAIHPRLTGSAAALIIARSMDSMQQAQAKENDPFSIASAPLEEPMGSRVQETSLAPTTSFREATFMSSSNLHKRKKHSRSVEQLDDFTPKYLYYDMQNVAQQNGALPEEETNTNYGVVNNNKTIF